MLHSFYYPFKALIKELKIKLKSVSSHKKSSTQRAENILLDV